MSERLHSKTAFVAELVPGKRKLVEFSIELANSPGALASVASILGKHKVNVLTGFHDSTQWGFFADVTETNTPVDEIIKEISGLAAVSKVALSEKTSEGIIVDTLHQQVVVGAFRTIIVRAEVMRSILDRVREIFGVDGKAGKAVLFAMGEAAGRTVYKEIVSQTSAEAARAHPEDIIGLFTAQGWGDFKLASLDLERNTACVNVSNGFESAYLNRPVSPSSDFTCDFTRGHLAGMLSEIFGKRLNATETLCVAHGHSHCQFEAQEAG